MPHGPLSAKICRHVWLPSDIQHHAVFFQKVFLLRRPRNTENVESEPMLWIRPCVNDWEKPLSADHHRSDEHKQRFIPGQYCGSPSAIRVIALYWLISLLRPRLIMKLKISTLSHSCEVNVQWQWRSGTVVSTSPQELPTSTHRQTLSDTKGHLRSLTRSLKY